MGILVKRVIGMFKEKRRLVSRKENIVNKQVTVGCVGSGKSRCFVEPAIKNCEKGMKRISEKINGHKHTVIVGQVGSGKSRYFVGPAIKDCKKPVLWISAKDDRKYLGLQDEVQLVKVKQLLYSPLEGKKKVNINNQELDHGEYLIDLEILKDYIRKVWNKDVLLVFEDIFLIFEKETLETFFQELIKEVPESTSVIIAIHDLRQIRYLERRFDDPSILQESLHSNDWNVIYI